MRRFLLAATLVALPAAANEFTARYPAGSIRDAVQAQAALKDADVEMARIAQSAKSREADCYRGFLVNSCRDDVRREKELAEREVRRVRLEASDLQRGLDAEQAAKRRTEQAKARAVEDARRPQKEAEARAAIETREVELKRQGSAAQSDQSSGAKSDGNDRQPSAPRLSAEQRAENVRKFQQKQVQAAEHAQEKEMERKKNEQRRAEKRKQIEQREAEREAVRKKAAELLK